MNKSLEFTKRFMHIGNGRRNKTSIVGTSAAYPILAFTKFSRIRNMSHPRLAHEFLMKFSHKPESHGKIIFSKSLYSVVKSIDVMQNIIDVRRDISTHSYFSFNRIDHSRHCAFDLA